MKDIDWTKESEKVKEACDLIVRAHEIYSHLPADEKQRFDILLDKLLPNKE